MSMTSPIFWAYLLIVSFFVLERVLRQGEAARSLQADQTDQGSSRLLWTIGLLNLLLVLLAPLLNTYGLGDWQSSLAGWVGIGLMVCGISLRTWAARTLGQFYTRTLRIVEDHQIVKRGPYRILRHPGYLATSIIEIGTGLALNNWIVLLVIPLTGWIAKTYRIHAEEAMLEAAFQDQYRAYREKTWKVIPLLY